MLKGEWLGPRSDIDTVNTGFGVRQIWVPILILPFTELWSFASYLSALICKMAITTPTTQSGGGDYTRGYGCGT